MSSIGTLYTVPKYAHGQRILAVAALAGLTLDVPQEYRHHEDNHKPEFLSKFASGKIPAFEGKDGFTLFESSAIARYVASLSTTGTHLLGTSLQQRALIDQWIAYMNTEIHPLTYKINGMLEHLIPYSRPVEKNLHERRNRGFSILDKHLSTRTFFVGERMTLADLHVSSLLVTSFEMTFDPGMRRAYPHLTRHFETIINHPKLKPIFGDITFVETAQKYKSE